MSKKTDRKALKKRRAHFEAERKRRELAAYNARYNGKTRGEVIAAKLAEEYSKQTIAEHDALYEAARNASMAFDKPKIPQSVNDIDWAQKAFDEIMADIEALAVHNSHDPHFMALLDMAAPSEDPTKSSQRFIDRWAAMKLRLAAMDAERQNDSKSEVEKAWDAVPGIIQAPRRLIPEADQSK